MPTSTQNGVVAVLLLAGGLPLRGAAASKEAERLLKEAERLAWLYNWVKAHPDLAEAQQPDGASWG